MGRELCRGCSVTMVPIAGRFPTRRQGALISSEQGKAVAYALWNLEDRGAIFIDPGEHVYQGMIIGLAQQGRRSARKSH